MGSGGPSDPASPCARCGSAIRPGAGYCGRCGLPVSVDAGERLPDRARDRSREGAAGAAGGTDTLADFLQGVDLLRRYPVLVAPPLIAMGVVFVAGILFFGGAMGLFAVGGLSRQGPGLAGALLGSALLLLVFFAVAMLINLVSSAVVIVMAEDALAARTPSLSAAYGRIMARLGDVVAASILCTIIIGVAAAFVIIPGIVAAFFLMFTLPVVVLDGAGPVEGLRRSAALVRDNAGRALGFVAGTVVASVILWLASTLLHVVPVAGHLASMLLGGAFFAYLTVVAVRVFETLPRR